MKKIMLLFGVVLFCVSCIKIPDNIPRIWGVQNKTEHTLILKCPYYYLSRLTIDPESFSKNDLKYTELELTPNAYIEICRGGIPKENKPWFDYYFKKSAEAFGEDVSWQILSEDGAVLKTWIYSDREFADQRLFAESEWRAKMTGVWHSWVFEIMPDDIEPAK